jgi:hypothetical protein
VHLFDEQERNLFVGEPERAGAGEGPSIDEEQQATRTSA